jgi:hypothetical protein
VVPPPSPGDPTSTVEPSVRYWLMASPSCLP